jgi:hypothetical protein
MFNSTDLHPAAKAAADKAAAKKAGDTSAKAKGEDS